MSDFVYDGTNLPTGKVDKTPLTGAATQAVTAAEWNSSMQAVADLRDAVLTGDFHGLASNPTAPVAGVNSMRLRNNAGDLEVSEDGGAYYRPDGDVFNVKAWGAKGDSTTNDTAAIAAATAALQAAGGGTLLFPPGTYIIGSQTFANGAGHGYSYTPAQVVHLNGCARPVLISGYGAKLKWASGLRYGSFDPVTGAVAHPAMPVYNTDYQASLGTAISVNSCAVVRIEGLEIDGNDSGLIIGGYWGDTGTQVGHSGVEGYQNSAVTLVDLYVHHHGLDGFALGTTVATEGDAHKPLVMQRCRSEYNGRQGLSLVGGNAGLFHACVFAHTGRGVVQSAPGAGVDIEAELGLVRDMHFDSCVMRDNAGPGVDIDSGDTARVRFTSCTLWGSSSWAVIISKPDLQFHSCRFFGAVLANGDRSQFVDCLITNVAEPARSTTASSVNGYLFESYGKGVVLERCRLVVPKWTALYPGAGASHYAVAFISPSVVTQADWTVIRGCYIEHQDSGLPDQGNLCVFANVRIEGTTFAESYSPAPVSGYYWADVSGDSCRLGHDVSVDCTYSKWVSWSGGAGATTGRLPHGSQTEKDSGRSLFRTLTLLKVPDYPGMYYGTAQICFGAVIPVAGTWTVGSIVLNNAPTTGQPVGWVCTVAGTPGTWKGFGTVS